MKPYIGIGIAATLLTITACSSMQPQQSKYDSPSQVEAQLKEINQKIDEVYHRVSVLQFMVDDHQRTLQKMEHPLSGNADPEKNLKSSAGETDQALSTASKPLDTPTAPIRPAEPKPKSIESSAAESYDAAFMLFKQTDYKKAFISFTEFAESNPKHDLADNALYWAGECLYAQKRFTDAVITFKKVIEEYPNGGKVPDAYLKIGYAYLALEDRINARIFLKEVIKNYPFSPASTKEEEKLKALQNN